MNFATVAATIYAIVIIALFFMPVKLLFKRYFMKELSHAEYQNRAARFEHIYVYAKAVGVALAFVLFLIKVVFFS